MEPSHLIITVHGIRTFGNWQERLEHLVTSGRASSQLEFVNYKFGFFSVVSFIVPFTRWLLVRRFRDELLRLQASKPRTRIDLVGHSFGTHLIAWAIASLPVDSKITIHTVILSGSVLRSAFPWHEYIGTRVKRVINDCGSRDGVLLLSQFLVFFTGMAGRSGFSGSTSATFRNRYSIFGHSGYFVDRAGAPSDDYLGQHWVPLLTSEHPAPAFDFREPPTTFDVFLERLATHAGLIKLAVCVSPFVVLWVVYFNLYTTAEQQRKIAVSRQYAAEAVSLFERNLDDAILVSARAFSTEPTSEARNVVYHAATNNPEIQNFLYHLSPNKLHTVSIDPRGRHFIVAKEDTFDLLELTGNGAQVITTVRPLVGAIERVA
jgi:pimeloyl-ACP methyl ester carboxylesterase